MQIDNYKLVQALKGKKPLDITLTPAPEWVAAVSKLEPVRMYIGNTLKGQEVVNVPKL